MADNITFIISIEEFYNFANSLMDCLPIFYEQSILRNKSSKMEENEICCICDENKSDVMLECYVY